MNDDYVPFRTMVKGSYFGEIDIILKQKRSHTVITGEICDTLTLSKQIYENIIIKEYPEIHEEIKLTAHLRLKKNEAAEKEINEKRGAVNMFPYATKQTTNNNLISHNSKSYISNKNLLNMNMRSEENYKKSIKSTNVTNNKKMLNSNMNNNVNNINIYSTTFNINNHVSPNNIPKFKLDSSKFERSLSANKDDRNSNSNTSQINDDKINEIKEELSKYSIQQKEILDNIHTIMHKIK